MAEQVAITVVGRDRPGIVAGIARVLYQHGCNIEDSSATILRDSFAMILIARLPEPPGIDDLADLLQLEAASLEVNCDLRLLDPPAPQTDCPGTPYTLAVYGADQPGIVYRVANELAAAGCNISDVSTRVGGTPERPLYIMVLDLTMPAEVDRGRLDRRLTELRAELDVDITLRPIDEATL